HGFDDGFESLLHVLGLADFVFAPFEVKTQHRNAPLVHEIGIDFAVSVGIGNHFAASGKPNGSAVTLAAGALQIEAVALDLVAQIVEHSGTGEFASTANLNVVAAWKIILAVVLPPGNVHVHAADAIVIVRRDFGHFRNVAPAVASDGVCEVAADPTGRVGKTVGEQFGLGIEEKTS